MANRWKYRPLGTVTYYNYMRDYDAQTGRYIESDPIGINGGSYSTYNYVWGTRWPRSTRIARVMSWAGTRAERFVEATCAPSLAAGLL